MHKLMFSNEEKQCQINKERSNIQINKHCSLLLLNKKKKNNLTNLTSFCCKCGNKSAQYLNNLSIVELNLLYTNPTLNHSTFKINICYTRYRIMIIGTIMAVFMLVVARHYTGPPTLVLLIKNYE